MSEIKTLIKKGHLKILGMLLCVSFVLGSELTIKQQGDRYSVSTSAISPGEKSSGRPYPFLVERPESGAGLLIKLTTSDSATPINEKAISNEVNKFFCTFSENRRKGKHLTPEIEFSICEDRIAPAHSEIAIGEGTQAGEDTKDRLMQELLSSLAKKIGKLNEEQAGTVIRITVSDIIEYPHVLKTLMKNLLENRVYNVEIIHKKDSSEEEAGAMDPNRNEPVSQDRADAEQREVDVSYYPFDTETVVETGVQYCFDTNTSKYSIKKMDIDAMIYNTVPEAQTRLSLPASVFQMVDASGSSVVEHVVVTIESSFYNDEVNYVVEIPNYQIRKEGVRINELTVVLDDSATGLEISCVRVGQGEAQRQKDSVSSDLTIELKEDADSNGAESVDGEDFSLSEEKATVIKVLRIRNKMNTTKYLKGITVSGLKDLVIKKVLIEEDIVDLLLQSPGFTGKIASFVDVFGGAEIFDLSVDLQRYVEEVANKYENGDRAAVMKDLFESGVISRLGEELTNKPLALRLNRKTKTLTGVC